MKVLLAALRQRFSRTPLYEPWRHYRERQQLSAFNRVLDSYLLPNSDVLYSVSNTKGILFEKKGLRRPFLGEDRKPYIVAFGAEAWERYGLWPTFRSIAHFNFFNYGEIESESGGQPNPAVRRTLGEEFLAYVDKLDQVRLVNACFFYADSTYIAPELLESLAQRGIWTIILGLDDKHRFYERDSYGMRIGQVTLVRHADLMWTTWKIGAEIILAAGGTPWYAPPAADPAFYHPMECEKDLEVVFVGQSYGSRANLVRYLRQRGFRVDAYGSGWPGGFMDFDEVVRLYSRAKVVLGAGGVQSMSGVQHLKGRDFEVPMCGALYLTSYNPELADHYEIGKEILCYSSPENCAEILHWILRRPAEQERIRQAALKRSLRDHTWEKRLNDMFALFRQEDK